MAPVTRGLLTGALQTGSKIYTRTHGFKDLPPADLLNNSIYNVRKTMGKE